MFHLGLKGRAQTVVAAWTGCHDYAAGGVFFCAGDNPCSDSQIQPLKSGITAVLGLFLGKILQRLPSLTPEIQNHCSVMTVYGENLAAIPKFNH